MVRTPINVSDWLSLTFRNMFHSSKFRFLLGVITFKCQPIEFVLW
jgi:hypothetical protein